MGGQGGPMSGQGGPMGGQGGPMGGPPDDPMMMMDNNMDMMDPHMGMDMGMGPPGPGGMNGGMDPMMDGPMMGDHMMPDDMTQMQPDHGFFDSSEYPSGFGTSRKADFGHEEVSRTTSMDLDSTVSVKKIEDREDEYRKVKQSLLSDFDWDTGDELKSPNLLRNENTHLNHPALSPLSPLMPSYLGPRPTGETRPTRSRRRRQSKDTLESIFGSSAAEPKSKYVDDTQLPPTTTESRSSSMLLLDSSLPDADQQHDFNQVDTDHSLLASREQAAAGRSILSSRVMVEEPFPVCISPEFDNNLFNKGQLQDVYTIQEVPEEDEASPPTTTAAVKLLAGKPAFGSSQIFFLDRPNRDKRQFSETFLNYNPVLFPYLLPAHFFS